MNSKAKQFLASTVSLFITLALTSCTSNVLLSVNHFQDAQSLGLAESRYFVSFEQALFFQFSATKRETNHFDEDLFIIAPNYQVGIGRRFELGVKVLPFAFSSSSSSADNLRYPR